MIRLEGEKITDLIQGRKESCLSHIYQSLIGIHKLCIKGSEAVDGIIRRLKLSIPVLEIGHAEGQTFFIAEPVSNRSRERRITEIMQSVKVI